MRGDDLWFGRHQKVPFEAWEAPKGTFEALEVLGDTKL